MDDQTQAIQTTTASPSDVVMSRTMFGGLDELTDEQFETLLRRAQIGMDRAREVRRRMMKPGVHYIIPGMDDPKKIKAAADDGKPVGLSKAGCELLWTMHGLVPGDPIIVVEYGDGVTRPAMTATAKVPIHRGDCSGPVVAWGVGMCTTHEDKYRWRDEQRKCPACGASAIIAAKYEDKFGPLAGLKPWLCFDKRGGCGAKYHPDDESIKGQTLGRVEHPNPLDLANTVIKMAAKRGTTDGTIKATRSSDLWSPDVEDMDEHSQRRMRERADRDVGEADVVTTEDPDAWRAALDQGEQNATPEPAPAPERAPTPTEAASDAQKKYARDLLRMKYGAKDDAAADRMLANINLDRSGHRAQNGVAGLTKADAAAVIKLLKDLPNMAKEIATA